MNSGNTNKNCIAFQITGAKSMSQLPPINSELLPSVNRVISDTSSVTGKVMYDDIQRSSISLITFGDI